MSSRPFLQDQDRPRRPEVALWCLETTSNTRGQQHCVCVTVKQAKRRHELKLPAVLKRVKMNISQFERGAIGRQCRAGRREHTGVVDVGRTRSEAGHIVR